MTASIGKTASYAVAAVFGLGAAAVLLSIRTEARAPAENSPMISSILEGLRFVRNNRIVLGAQMLDMFAVLFGGAVSLLPAFVQDVFSTGPETLGLLRAAPALGGMATGIMLSHCPISRNNGHWMLGTVAGFGICIIGFALSGDLLTAAMFLLLSGMCDGVSMVTRTTIIQLVTPDAMRGRVAAINGIFIGSSNELGAFESGLAARFLGLVPSVVFGGVMTLIVVGVTGWFAPELRRFDLKQLD